MPMSAYERSDGILVVSREEFCSARFVYKPGQHVTFGGPSQWGKTSLCFDLLEYVATPELPAYVAVSKPKDKVTEQRGRDLDYRFVEEWPAPPSLKYVFNGKPSGYIVKPRFGDINKDAETTGKVLGNLLADRYIAGIHDKNGILVLDDTLVKAKVQGLDKQMVTLSAMAGAMGLGAWMFVQKPTGAGQAVLMSYSNSEHIFLTHDKDERNRRRYNEIGGFDSKLIFHVVATLGRFQFLYVNAEGQMCIVDKKQ